MKGNLEDLEWDMEPEENKEYGVRGKAQMTGKRELGPI